MRAPLACALPQPVSSVAPQRPAVAHDKSRGLSLVRALAVDLAQPGVYLELKNAKVDMYRGSMKLILDKQSSVEVTKGQTFEPRVSAQRARRRRSARVCLSLQCLLLRHMVAPCLPVLTVHNVLSAVCVLCSAERLQYELSRGG